eukprot:COSAG01_NODE_2446_length_7684_cov_126.363564_13_plen_103_part_00
MLLTVRTFHHCATRSRGAVFVSWASERDLSVERGSQFAHRHVVHKELGEREVAPELRGLAQLGSGCCVLQRRREGEPVEVLGRRWGVRGAGPVQDISILNIS